MLLTIFLCKKNLKQKFVREGRCMKLKVSLLSFLVAGLIVISSAPGYAYKDAKAMVKSYAKRYGVKQIAPAQFKKMKFDLIIDVREPKEYKAGHIKGAINIPRGVLEFFLTSKTHKKTFIPCNKRASTRIIIYCKSGARGILATASLKQLGFKRVCNLKGGFKAAKKAGIRIVK